MAGTIEKFGAFTSHLQNFLESQGISADGASEKIPGKINAMDSCDGQLEAHEVIAYVFGHFQESSHREAVQNKFQAIDADFDLSWLKLDRSGSYNQVDGDMLKRVEASLTEDPQFSKGLPYHFYHSEFGLLPLTEQQGLVEKYVPQALQKDFHESLLLLNRDQKLSKIVVRATLLRADELRRSGETQKALGLLNLTYEIDPDNSLVRYELAGHYYAQGQPSQAFPHALAGLKAGGQALTPSDWAKLFHQAKDSAVPNGWDFVGGTLVDQGRLEAAGQVYQEASQVFAGSDQAGEFQRKYLLTQEALHPYPQQFSDPKIKEIYQALQAKGVPTAFMDAPRQEGFVSDAKVLDYLVREWPHFEVRVLCEQLGINTQELAEIYLQHLDRAFSAELNQFKYLAKTDRDAAERLVEPLMEKVARYQFLLSERSPKAIEGLEPFRLLGTKHPNPQHWTQVLEFYQLVEEFYATEKKDFSQNMAWQHREWMGKGAGANLLSAGWEQIQQGALNLMNPFDMEYQQELRAMTAAKLQAKEAKEQLTQKHLAMALGGQNWVRFELLQKRTEVEVELKENDCVTPEWRQKRYQQILKYDQVLGDTKHAIDTLSAWELELLAVKDASSDPKVVLDAYGQVLQNVLEFKSQNTDPYLESQLSVKVMDLIHHMNDSTKDLQAKGLLPDKKYQAEDQLRQALMRMADAPHGELWPLLSAEGLEKYFRYHHEAAGQSKLAFQAIHDEEDRLKGRMLLLEALGQYVQLRDGAMVETLIEDIKTYTSESMYPTGLELIEIDYALYQTLKGSGLSQEAEIREDLFRTASSFLSHTRSYSHDAAETRGLLLLRNLYAEENDRVGLAAVEKKIRGRQEEQGERLVGWYDAYRITREATGGMDMDSAETKAEKLSQAGQLLETDLMFLGSSDLTQEGTRVVMKYHLWSDFDVALNILNHVTELPEEARKNHIQKLGFTLASLRRFTTGEFAFLTPEEYQQRLNQILPLADEYFDRAMPLTAEATDDEKQLHQTAKELFREKFKLSLEAGEAAWFSRLETEYLLQFKEAAMAVTVLAEPRNGPALSKQQVLETQLKIGVVYGQLGLAAKMDEALAPFREFLQDMPDPMARADRTMALVDIYMNADRSDRIKKTNELLQEIVSLDPGPAAASPQDKALHVKARMALAFHHLNEGKLDEAKDVLLALKPHPGAEALLEKLEQGTQKMRQHFTLRVTRSVLQQHIHRKREKAHEGFETEERAKSDNLLVESNRFLDDLEKQLEKGKLPEEIFSEFQADGKYTGVFQYLKVSDRGKYLQRFLNDTASPMLSDRKFSQAALKLAQDLVDDKDYQSGMEICEFLRNDPYVGDRAKTMAKEDISSIARSDALLSALWTELKNATIIFADSKEEAFKSLILLVAGFGIGKLAATGAKAGYAMWAIRGWKGASFLTKHRGIGMGLVGMTAEAAAFTTTNMLGSAVLHNNFSHLTWGNWGKEFGAMMVTFGLLHGYGAGLSRISPKVLASESAWLRKGFGVAAYSGQVFMFTASGYINEGIGFHEATDAPFALRLFQSALMDAHMRLAHKAVSPLTKGWEQTLKANTMAISVLEQLKVPAGSRQFTNLHEALMEYSRPYLKNPQEMTRAWEGVLHLEARWAERSGFTEVRTRQNLLEQILRSGWDKSTLEKIDRGLVEGKLRFVFVEGKLRLEEIPGEEAPIPTVKQADTLSQHRDTLVDFQLKEDLSRTEADHFEAQVVDAVARSQRSPQEVRQAYATLHWATESAGMEAGLLRRVLFIKMIEGSITLKEAEGIARGVWRGELKLKLKSEPHAVSWDVLAVTEPAQVSKQRHLVRSRMAEGLPENLWEKYSPEERSALRGVFSALGYGPKQVGDPWTPKTPEAKRLLKVLHVEASTSGTEGPLDLIQLKRLEKSAPELAQAATALAEAGLSTHPRHRAQILTWAWFHGKTAAELRSYTKEVQQGNVKLVEEQGQIRVQEFSKKSRVNTDDQDTQPWAARSSLEVEILPPELYPVSSPKKILGERVISSLVRSLKNQYGQEIPVELVAARGHDAIAIVNQIESMMPAAHRKAETLVVAHLEGEGGRHFLVADTYANLTSVAKVDFLLKGDYRSKSFYLDYQVEAGATGQPPHLRVGYLQVDAKLARPTLLMRMLSGLTESMEGRFPGAKVETRASNLVSGELLTRGLGAGQFVLITDAKKHPIQNTFDPVLIDHLVKSEVLRTEDARDLLEGVANLSTEVAQHREQLKGMVEQGMMTSAMAEAQAFSRVDPKKLVQLHNEMILAIRAQYQRALQAGNTQAKSELEFFYQNLRQTPGGKALLRNPFRGDFWVEGTLKGQWLEALAPHPLEARKPAESVEAKESFSFADLNEELGLAPPSKEGAPKKVKPDYKVDNEFLAESQSVTEQYFAVPEPAKAGHQVATDPHLSPPQLRQMAPKLEILEKWGRSLNFNTGKSSSEIQTRHMGQMGRLANEALTFLQGAKNLETQLWNVEFEIYLLKTPLKEMNPSNRKFSQDLGYDILSRQGRVEKIIEKESERNRLETELNAGLEKIFLFETAYEQVGKRLDEVYQLEWAMVENMMPKHPKELPLVLDVESGLRMEISLEELVLPNGNRAAHDDLRGIPPIAYIGEQVMTGLGEVGKVHDYPIDMGIVTVTARSAKDIPQVARVMLKRFGPGRFERILESSEAWMYLYESRKGTRTMIRIVEPVSEITPDMIEAQSALPPPIPAPAKNSMPLAAKTTLAADSLPPEIPITAKKGKLPGGSGTFGALLAGLGTLLTPKLAHAATESAQGASDALLSGAGILGLAAVGIAGILTWTHLRRKSAAKPSAPHQGTVHHQVTGDPWAAPQANPGHRTSMQAPPPLPLPRDASGKILPPDWIIKNEVPTQDPRWQEPALVNYGGAAARTHRGISYSKTNEDRFAVMQLPDGRQVLLAIDGIGGHGGGDVAAETLRRTLHWALEQGASLKEAMQAGQDVLHSRNLAEGFSDGEGKVSGRAPGAVLIGVEITPQATGIYQGKFLSVSDSEALVLRRHPESGEWLPVVTTQKPTKIVQMMREGSGKKPLALHPDGRIKMAEALNLHTAHMANVVEATVGAEKYQVDQMNFTLKKGDLVLTMSDGAGENFSYFEIARMAETVQKNGRVDPAALTDALVNEGLVRMALLNMGREAGRSLVLDHNTYLEAYERAGVPMPSTKNFRGFYESHKNDQGYYERYVLDRKGNVHLYLHDGKGKLLNDPQESMVAHFKKDNITVVTHEVGQSIGQPRSREGKVGEEMPLAAQETLIEAAPVEGLAPLERGTHFFNEGIIPLNDPYLQQVGVVEVYLGHPDSAPQAAQGQGAILVVGDMAHQGSAKLQGVLVWNGSAWRFSPQETVPVGSGMRSATEGPFTLTAKESVGLGLSHFLLDSQGRWTSDIRDDAFGAIQVQLRMP